MKAHHRKRPSNKLITPTLKINLGSKPVNPERPESKSETSSPDKAQKSASMRRAEYRRGKMKEVSDSPGSKARQAFYSNVRKRVSKLKARHASQEPPRDHVTVLESEVQRLKLRVAELETSQTREESRKIQAF